MRIMVLGASGYLGRRLSMHLQQEGHDVVCVGRFHENEYKRDMAYLQDSLNIVDSYMKNNSIDWIINCVAQYEGGKCNYEGMLEANYLYGMKMLLLAQRNKINNFLTIDTSLPKTLNFYSLFKKQFAEFGCEICKKTEMHFVNVVLEMFYGEDEPENRFLVSCCNKMILNEKLELTEGSQKRDIIYIQDVCGAIEAIISSKQTGYMEVPVGSGQAPSIREILEHMHKYLNSASNLAFGEVLSRENEPDCLADTTMLKELGYQIKYNWRNGIEHFCDEILKKRM